MLDPRVLDKMLPLLKQVYGNASSTEHSYGWEANEIVNESREQVSSLINCSPNEIIFTSGATESNNISILGAIDCFKDAHAITLKTEHKSILDVFKKIEKNNYSATYIDVNSNGVLNLNSLKEAIKPNTKLISIMLANNEIGVIQPIIEISEFCKKNGIILHVDAAQAVGKIDINLKKTNIDLMSISSHKIYGPKGIGCIYINQRTMKNRINPINYGGGQEKGLRPGTLAVHNIAGFGEACRILKDEREQDQKHIKSLTDLFYNKIKSNYNNTVLNGDKDNRIAGNLNLTFKGLNDQPLIPKLTNIAVSSGSACTSSTPEPSHVLKAIGLHESLIKSTIRIGIGKFNTKEEIEKATEHLLEIIRKLRINKNEDIND
tara:strand:+ start:13957 stop:15084 length:1128 start_codon:yes stop_codon:yes gene_type:complete